MTGFFSGCMVLVALGVILIWGIDGTVRGIDVNTIGGILVLVGLVGALFSLVVWAKRNGSSLPADDESRVFRR